MRLFKKAKKETVSTDAVAERIAGRIVARQRQLADYLNSKTAKFKSRRVAYVLMMGCIAFAGYCAYLLISSINN